jgi:hypothetical protein
MICPFCAEKIKDQATLCRFCGKDVVAKAGSAPVSSEIENENEILDENFNSVILPTNRFAKFTKTQKIIAIGLITVLALAGGTLGLKKFSEVKEKNRIAAIAKAEADAEAAAFQAELDAYQAAVKDNSWVPSGYTKFTENPFLAYKAISYSNCSGGSCFPFQVVSSKYCSKIYIQSNIVRGTTILDWTNDTAYNVSPGQAVKMKMTSYEDLPWTIDWSEVRCS